MNSYTKFSVNSGLGSQYICCTKMPISDQTMGAFQKRQHHLENKKQAKEK